MSIPKAYGLVPERGPALYRPKRKWCLASQHDPLDYLEQTSEPGGVWRRNYSTLEAYEDQVLEVMHDQASRGQLLVLSETEAKKLFPGLVIAFLGAKRKGEPGGKATARVLFDGTHGLSVNCRTRLRDQERAPIAADLKRTMREKAKLDELTFALTADVTEAHRQVPVHPDGLALLPAVRFSSTRLALSVLHRRPIAGLGLLQLSVDYRGTWLLVSLQRGTCWWLKICGDFFQKG